MQTTGTNTIQQPYAQLALDFFGIKELTDDQLKLLKYIDQQQDILAVLPTGSGKSMCYQLPSLVGDGVVLVVSPLIALMKDQHQFLKKSKVPSVLFSYLQNQGERLHQITSLEAMNKGVVFCSPEKLNHKEFIQSLKNIKLKLIAVDEAHCISSWGHGFRPEYLGLGKLLDQLGKGIPRLALTATATKKMSEEIISVLDLQEPYVLQNCPVRKNIEMVITKVPSVEVQKQSVLELLEQVTQTSIVYVKTRSDVDRYSSFLRGYFGQRVASYHGGMSSQQRSSAGEWFYHHSNPIMVATNAFGLGIDRPDIGVVVHVAIGSSLEQHVQEIGRAGRDGNAAKAVCLYTSRDIAMAEYFFDSSFPDFDLLDLVFNKLGEDVDHLRQVEVESFKKKLTQLPIARPSTKRKLKLSSKKIDRLLETLHREKVLSVWSGQGEFMEGRKVIELLFDQQRFQQEFSGPYKERRHIASQKLSALKSFLIFEGDRNLFIQEYFKF